ncbi:MAG TPA: precorrin-6Y C5,15-methyltransferase (decarboxylating) subunit CbiT [Euryarchaeota archaeon]|nr:putative cobalt-precorrin-6Y C(15)-methyltransferase [decarboxylating] [archaeon BMS3Bbin15]HDL15162.1 precorrin-6Y C5,15-methyltransferase (decarboxylating) subunit CbiT [Euryarchaeota archaeon]
MNRCFGIADNEFIRGKVPMTKEEVRAVILHRLRLNRNSIVADIGAGTGSLSIEAALLASEGRVYAVEKSSEAIGILKANIDKFGADNIEVIHGEAPEALESLPGLDRVIVGGSSGKIEDIINGAKEKLRPGGRIVISLITLENLCTALEVLEGSFEPEVSEIIVAKAEKLGKYKSLKARNPVFIVSGEIR